MEIHDCKTFASRTGTEINKSSFSSISEYEKKHILAITYVCIRMYTYVCNKHALFNFDGFEILNRKWSYIECPIFHNA